MGRIGKKLKGKRLKQALRDISRNVGCSEVKSEILKNEVLLEWSYTPADYFENEIHISGDCYEMIIEDGNVEARINPSVYDQEHNMRDFLHESLNNRFLGAQLLVDKPYDLSEASMSRLHSDGRKDVTVFVKTGKITMTGLPVDIVETDKDGNVVSDSRKERIEKKKRLAELAEAYATKDSVAASILSSYKAALNDPDNELVHLYEIRDALKKLFSSEANALKELNLSAADWSHFGKLANFEPLNQGRHRGSSVGKLRDASKGELKEARNIARGFVEAYLVYLDANNS